MSLVAPVTDGSVVATSTTSTSESTTGTSNLGKNDFLQLLVAQMQYQDPLEPTSNTEYISQYATFSELEEMQNVSASTDLSRASALVGKEVVIASTSDTGETNYINGSVDYVQIENGSALLAINDSLYSLDDLYSVADSAYLEAVNVAQTFVTDLTALPTVANLTLSDESSVNELSTYAENMSDYSKTFIADDVFDLLQEYVDKLAELNLGETEDTEET